MQPVISFWVLCNPFNLFGYYATRLIRFLGTMQPVMLFLGTMQPVISFFGYYATRFKLFLPLGTMQSIFGYHETVISLSDPSLCTTMQPVTLSQPIYFLSIGYYTIPHFIIGYHDYATLSGITQPVLLSLTCYFINFCAPFSTRIIVCYLAHYFVSVESY